MKKMFLTVVALMMAVIAMPSCSSAGNDEGQDYPDPVEDATLTLADNQSATREFVFAAKENWRISVDAEWLTVAPRQGTAGTNRKVTLTVDANDAAEPRTAMLRVESLQNAALMTKLTVSQPGREVTTVDDENPSAPAGMKKNAVGLVKAIRIGWNLGNTCEASPYEGWRGDELDIETLWGNPKTTKAMITALKDAGFNAVRIPVRWCVHADADLNISAVWLNRIKEIVDYAVSQGMYAIVNSHHDGWFHDLPPGYNESTIRQKYARMWTQIAETFKQYDEHLILAGANEIIKLNADGSQNWGTPTESDLLFTNRLMQLFVSTVRATGGNNAWRCLIVLPWAANPHNALTDAFQMPTDDTPHRLLLEYHCYDPYHYAIGKDLPDNQFAQHEFTDADKQPIGDLFLKLGRKFVDAGIPVVMGEFGSTQDDHYSGGQAKADKMRADYLEFMVSEARKYHIPAFYWDNNAFKGNGESFGLLDRGTCTFPARSKVALEGMMRGLK